MAKNRAQSAGKKLVGGTVERKKKEGAGGKPEEPKKPKKPKGEPVPKDGDGKPPVTVVREKHTCGCKATNQYFFKVGSVKNLRVALTVSSVVTCDPSTPDHCKYTYTATAVFQQYVRQRARWVAVPATRRPFIAKFSVKDPVNSTEAPDRIDKSMLEIVDWFPKAPQKDTVDIELRIVASIRGKWTRDIKRKATLCLPKLDNPVCPEKK